MKKLFTLSLFSFISVFIFAQANDPCATMAVYHQQQQDPQIAAHRAMTESCARAWLAQHPHAGHERSALVITVPVVVHVVYITPAQNISDQQSYSQIAILNRD